MLCRSFGRLLREGIPSSPCFLNKWNILCHQFSRSEFMQSQFALDETSIRKLIQKGAGSLKGVKSSHYSRQLQEILSDIETKQSELKDLESMAQGNAPQLRSPLSTHIV